MKYQANKRKKEREKTSLLESEIDRLQNSLEEKDIESVNNMKKELQEVEDKRDMMSARIRITWRERDQQSSSVR